MNNVKRFCGFSLLILILAVCSSGCLHEEIHYFLVGRAYYEHDLPWENITEMFDRNNISWRVYRNEVGRTRHYLLFLAETLVLWPEHMGG